MNHHLLRLALAGRSNFLLWRRFLIVWNIFVVRHLLLFLGRLFLVRRLAFECPASIDRLVICGLEVGVYRRQLIVVVSVGVLGEHHDDTSDKHLVLKVSAQNVLVDVIIFVFAPRLGKHGDPRFLILDLTLKLETRLLEFRPEPFQDIHGLCRDGEFLECPCSLNRRCQNHSYLLSVSLSKITIGFEFVKTDRVFLLKESSIFKTNQSNKQTR